MQPISDVERDDNIYSEIEMEEGCEVDNEIDSTWESENSSEDETDATIRPNPCPIDDLKFISFLSSLLPLLKVCLACPAYARILNYYVKGSALVVTLLCTENNISTWTSQPKN